MKIENAIGWCDETTNAVTGCDKVSAGCTHCYAQVGTRARVLRAQGIETWGPNGVRHPVAQFATKLRSLNKKCVCDRCHEAHAVDRLEMRVESGSAVPAADNGGGHRPPATCACGGQLRRIRLFADSNSDWMDEKWPIEVFANFLNEIRLAPDVDVLLLTKRPEKWQERLAEVHEFLCEQPKTHTHEERQWVLDWRWNHRPPQGVWIGVSVENQAMSDLRIPQLLAIPSAVRFLSCEPLLENIHFPTMCLVTNPGDPSCCTVGADGCFCGHIDWVIVGGESGKDRRDCGVGPIVSIAEQCKQAGVACYVKQDCAFKSGEQGRIPAEIWGLKQFPVVCHRGTEMNEESRKA